MRASISSPSFAAMALTHRNVAMASVQFTDLGPTEEEIHMTFDEEAAVEIVPFQSLKASFCSFLLLVLFFLFFVFDTSLFCSWEELLSWVV
jgi:hypothetical protein